MEPPLDPPLDQPDEKILKPKRTRTMTEEAKKEYAERMRKVNEDRCIKARLENEAKLELVENEIKTRTEAKLKKIEEKKQQIKTIKETEAVAKEVATSVKEEKPLKKQKAKRIVVQESSDSDDYNDEGETDSEEEVIYVAKKPKKKSQKSTSIVKEKKQTPAPAQALAPPKTIIKFF